MLKIKDNVDLKKLEKYYFVRDYFIDEWVYYKEYKHYAYEESLIVYEKDREIQAKGIRLLDTLYDLIKADLVEKVDDK